MKLIPGMSGILFSSSAANTLVHLIGVGADIDTVVPQNNQGGGRDVDIQSLLDPGACGDEVLRLYPVLLGDVDQNMEEVRFRILFIR